MTGIADTGRAQALLVRGGRPLRGRVSVPGNKHGMVLGFAAAVTLGAELSLGNVPALSERDALEEAVTALGGEVAATEEGVARIRGALTGDELPAASTRAIHGSLYLIPAVLAQRGSVVFHGSGGDHLGRFEWGLPRPLRHMLEVMESFGARWEWRGSELRVTAPRLRPATVDVLRWSQEDERPAGPLVSGATKTALLMAAAAPGTSLILNPHEKEAPHELIGMLRALGVEVEQRDACWVVRGGRARPGGRYELMPDPVELMTWQTFAAMTGSTIELDCGETARAFATTRRELGFLEGLGVRPALSPTTITVGPAEHPYGGAVLIAESTGVSTDIAPLLAVLLLRATGKSIVEDRVWAGRYGYAAQLGRMGARMAVSGNRLLVEPSALHAPSGPLTPSDTRSAAVCLAAALSVPGTTVVGGVTHLARGYQDLLPRLAALGAAVERTEVEDLTCSA